MCMYTQSAPVAGSVVALPHQVPTLTAKVMFRILTMCIYSHRDRNHTECYTYASLTEPCASGTVITLRHLVCYSWVSPSVMLGTVALYVSDIGRCHASIVDAIFQAISLL